MGQQDEDDDASTQYCVCQQTDSGAYASTECVCPCDSRD